MMPRPLAPLSLLLAAGCLSAPSYTAPISVSYSEDGTGAKITAPDFELHFGAGDSFHFPDALRIDGIDALGHDPTQPCFYENEAGFRISPTPRVSADGGAAIAKNELRPVMQGPAVVQVELAWATQLACSSLHIPGGTSTFTVFPDRRIVRHDRLDDPMSMMNITANQCTCENTALEPPDAFAISSYWTFDSAAFERTVVFETNMAAVASADILPFPGGLGTVPRACIEGTQGHTYSVMSTWPLIDNIENRTTVHRIGNVITLGRWVAYGSSGIKNVPWDRSTTLSIKRDDCATAISHAIPPTMLTIDGTTLPYSDLDGIYGGNLGDDKPSGAAVKGNHAELSGTIPEPFAVWFRFDHSVDAVRATLKGQSGAWYIPQRVGDDAWIIWFSLPLSVTQAIQIDAL